MPKYLKSLQEIDQIRLQHRNTTIRKKNENVDRVSVPDNDSAGNQNSETIPVCHLAYFMPFTQKDNDEPLLSMGSYQGAYAVALAAEHLNSGNGSIVDEVQGLNDRCNIKFSLEMFDTKGLQTVAVDRVIEVTSREQYLPCAFLGAAYSSVSIPMSIISGLRGYPQLSAFSTSSDLNDKAVYPLFGRTITSDEGTAVPLVNYFKDVLKIKYLAVVYMDDAYGISYSRGISDAAKIEAPDMVIKQIEYVKASGDSVKENAARVIEALKETKFMYFFAIVDSESLEIIMKEAYDKKIAGTGKHTWFFGDGIGSAITQSDTQNVSLRSAYQGTGRLAAAGGNSNHHHYLNFEESMRLLNNEKDNQYVMSLLPISDETKNTIKDNIGMQNDHSLVSTFLYDATIAIGLAACDFDNGAYSIENHTYFNGTSHFANIKQRSFNGSSGMVKFDKLTGTRDPESAYFSVDNFVYDEKTRKFGVNQSAFYEDGKWYLNNYYEHIYNDNTTGAPPELEPNAINENHIGPGIHIVGFTFAVIGILMSICFAIWSQLNRKKAVIKASQPIFLHLICLGTAFMASSILTLITDNGIAPIELCNLACILFPCQLSVGFSLIFAALFSKTHRINIIFQKAHKCERAVVEAKHVMKPLILILAANFSVFLTWIFVDPIHYDTAVVRTDEFGRKIETYGICTSENQYIYIISLSLINICAICITLKEAKFVSHISTEFHESKYIIMVMALVLLACFIGVPVIIIAREVPTAYYFVFMGIIFTISCSVLLLIFIPKVRKSRKNYRPKLLRNKFSFVSEIESIYSSNQSRESKLLKENSKLKRQLQSIYSNGNDHKSLDTSDPGAKSKQGIKVQFFDRRLYKENIELKRQIYRLSRENGNNGTSTDRRSTCTDRRMTSDVDDEEQQQGSELDSSSFEDRDKSNLNQNNPGFQIMT